MNFLKYNFGQTLVELLITIGLASILIPSLLGAFSVIRSGRAQMDKRVQATSYLKEAQEAIRIVDANDWVNLIDGTFYPTTSGTTWVLVPGTQSLNGFQRQIMIADVYRDANGNIAATGTLDPSTKKITITVTWTSPLAGSVSDVSYLTRHKNILQTETTVADFSPGTNTNTAVTNTNPPSVPNDGQVELGAGGAANGGDWCKPAQYVLQTFNLPGQGVAQNISATSTATQNVAYTTTGNNASGDAVDGLTISFAIPTPAVANPHSNNEAKAYGIFVDAGGNYVYFNENNPPNHLVRIANASDLSDLGTLDVSNKTGKSVYTSGNYAYVVSGNTLYSFNISNKNGSHSPISTVTLAGNGEKVVVIGSNVYVATDSTTSQMQIIPVNVNTGILGTPQNINLNNNLAGVDLFVNDSQTFAFVVTASSSAKNDFFIIDLNNTNNKYGYQTPGMTPKGITVVPRNRAIIVGTGGGYLYQVFDTTIPSAATNCGGMTPTGVASINAVASVAQPDGRVFSYILTDNSSAEFQIVLGGPGSGNFASSGSYTSAPFQVSHTSFFNRITATISQPVKTTIGLQVAVAHAVNGSCATAAYTFVGPDGTTGSYYTPIGNIISGQIPLSGNGNYLNPGECFAYKATFSSDDSTLTPILYDFSVNYSP